MDEGYTVRLPSSLKDLVDACSHEFKMRSSLCLFLQGYIESVSESEVSKSCLTLRPHGLEPTRLRDRTWVSSIAGRRFYHLSHQGSPKDILN